MQRRNFRLTCICAACLAVIVGTVLLLRQSPERHEAAREAEPLKEIARSVVTGDEFEEIRFDLREAFGHEAGVADRRRLDNLKTLTGELGEIDKKALIDELLRPMAPDEDIGWYAEYFHEICRILQGQEDMRERFARALATVVEDRSRDQTIRDYGLQHLRTIWASSPDDEDLRESVLATFRQVIQSDPGLAPSALLSLHLLGSDFSGASADRENAGEYLLPDSELLPLVSGILENPSSMAPRDAGARMAALRVVADRRMTGLLPLVRAIAEEKVSEHPVTRMAAISALGRLADPDDRVLLQSLDREDPRIAGAVDHALRNFPEL